MENKKSFPKAFFVLIIFTLLTVKTAWAQEPAPCEHDWGFPTWTCADDYSAATAHFTCALCGETEDVVGTLADEFNLADGHKVYRVTHNGQYLQQVFGPHVLQPGLNQTLQTNHPYFIQLPYGQRHGAYHIWTGDARAVKYYILDDEDVSSINFTPSGESIYYVANSDRSPNDFDGNLDYFHSDGFLYGIVFWARDEGESVTVNVKGVMNHTYALADDIIGGTVNVVPRRSTSNYHTNNHKAYEDDIVWLDPAPEEGFEIMSMTVTDVKGRDVPVLEHESRKYFIMPEVAVTISAQYRPTTWAALQTVLSNASTDANDPTVLALAADITATDSDAYLNLPSGCHVILDLNGHTIDRNMTEATNDGWVIKVNSGASLTIRDTAGGGTITGGWSTFSGAGIVSSSATLNIEGGTISGCRTTNQGGSAIKASGTLRISGGTITGNIANTGNNYGAMAATIYLSGTSNFYLSDGSISGNYCGYTNAGTAGIGSELGYGAATLHLSGNYTLSGNRMGTYDADHDTWTDLTASDLHNSARITVTIDDIIGPSEPAALVLNNYGIDNWKATFTSGWSTHMDGLNPEDYFTLVDNSKVIRVVDGEAKIGTPHVITLDYDITSSTAEAIEGMAVTLGYSIDLPDEYTVRYYAEAGGNDITATAISGNILTMPDEDVTITVPITTVEKYGALTIIEDENGKTAVFDAASEIRIELDEDIEVKTVVYNRTFTVGRASTVILPFDYNNWKDIYGGTFYRFDDVVYDNTEGKWVVNMTRVGGKDYAAEDEYKISAHTPYLYMPNDTHMSFYDIVTLQCTQGNETFSSTGSNDAWRFTGSYGMKEWDSDSDDYGFAAVAGKATDGVTDIEAGQFVRFTGDGVNNAFIKPMRCYLSYVGSQNAPKRGRAQENLPQVLTVRLKRSNGSTTDIGTIDLKNGTFHMDIWYDLTGRMLDCKPSVKGIYIHNGQKVVIE